MLAGIVKLDGGLVSTTQRRELLRRLRRGNSRRPTHEHSLKHALLVRASTGALSSYPGMLIDGKNVSVLAGSPLTDPRYDDLEDHQALVSNLAEERLSALQRARGTFCGVRYSEEARPLLEIFGDKNGVRPLYYWTDGATIVFSSALRVLESLSFLKLTRDDRGVAESIGFGISLADRTVYRQIRVIREGELIRFTHGNQETHRYWDWSRISCGSEINREAATREAYDIFCDAIKVRQRGEAHAVSFLSGGMDSRAIVGSLIDLGVSVTALNLGPRGSQDHVLAERFAQRIGCDFHWIPAQAGRKQFSATLPQRAADFLRQADTPAPRPYALWAGDGGSVCVGGGSSLDEQTRNLMRSGDSAEGLRRFQSVNHIGLPLKVMKPEARASLSEICEQGIRDELARMDSDPATALFLFLVVNSQRRHLASVYEDLDQHQVEYQLPFFDAKFLEFVFGLPLEYRMGHRFYVDWFQRFPDAVTGVPWQTYPSAAEPCPLPIPEELAYQWDKKPTPLTRRIMNRVADGWSDLTFLLSAADLGPISRPRFGLMTVLELLGLRSFGQARRAARRYAAVPPD